MDEKGAQSAPPDFAGDEMRFVIYNNAAKCRSVIRTIKRRIKIWDL